MATATSRAALPGIAALAVVAVAGCGGGPGPFAWVSPQASPAGWSVARIATGAAVPIPPHWKRISGDRGTATAATFDGHGHIVGYLNLTPRQGRETLANWRTFRVEHNADEGEKNVRRLAVAEGLRFGSGRGACVKDSYTTATGAAYVELACLIHGTVIVGAAPPRDWASIAPLLERSIAAVRS
jgi:hypothetical protein